MSPFTHLQLYVEKPATALRVITAAGRLDVAGAVRVVRLAEAQLDLAAAGHGALTHLVVDLSGVTSFEAGAVETLRHLRHGCATAGAQVHLAGCAGRLLLLPLRVRQVLTEFSTYPTLEVALAALVPDGGTPDEHSARPGRSALHGV
ncbi:STAS domain-containing protein [Pseudonocardia sp.]|jgi:anti-anti-sigma regulatory factor|uniref:STAS domain-containing protein n=1 Tax=Pseudonocardia sp. TaxID=60912 RepID=UPI002608A882|nr:STAS domain-containing protein [Pseudonocardia sp.]MCW2719586.1 hypothetical protein [Pseudonocardia sp.]MDT7617405.1 hypothetical protein [Pseudonocardiales bacterium]